MTLYVGLLYSIVIDARRRVVMSDLRAIAEGLGYSHVRTLVSSGNLVFETAERSVPAIEQALETAFATFYDKHVDIIVKSADDWRRLVAGNPFPAESAAAPDRVSIRIMRDPLRPDLAEDRGKFAEILRELEIPAPPHGEANTMAEARATSAVRYASVASWNSWRA